MQEFKQLSNFLEKYSIQLSDYAKQQFYTYYEMLVETNKVMNLTAITEFDEVEEKHFLDSIASAAVIDYKKYDSLIDIGTGAGFPGIPLKIIFPHLKIVLVDSLNKRVNFLNNIIEKLEFSEIYAIHGRAEELSRQSEYREQFDICTSRAVSRLSALSELTIPFVKKNGIFVAYKSVDTDEEIKNAKKAVSVMGGNINNISDIEIGKNNLNRRFVVIEKIGKTPEIYPRKNGIPQKKPIGDK